MWVINHLPTGYRVCTVIGARKLAQSLADEIAGAADWNFTDPEDARSRGAAVKAVMDRTPSAFITHGEAGPPSFTDAEQVSA